MNPQGFLMKGCSAYFLWKMRKLIFFSHLKTFPSVFKAMIKKQIYLCNKLGQFQGISQYLKIVACSRSRVHRSDGSVKSRSWKINAPKGFWALKRFTFHNYSCECLSIHAWFQKLYLFRFKSRKNLTRFSLKTTKSRSSRYSQCLRFTHMVKSRITFNINSWKFYSRSITSVQRTAPLAIFSIKCISYS